MKRWYAGGIPCPECKANLIPVFSVGFWRIPEHTKKASGQLCAAVGNRVVAS